MYDSMYDEIWIINSFFGLEDPTCLPPNVKLIGPTSEPQDVLLGYLEKEEPEIFKWLEDASQKKQNVVFVSLTNFAKW